MNKKKYDWPGVAYHSKEYWRLYRLVNGPQQREYGRAYSALRRITHPEEEYLRRQRYRDKWPEKISAHREVKKAVARGDLVSLPCRECGDWRTDAHHEDYAKPLDAIWLCSLHHARHHHESQPQ